MHLAPQKSQVRTKTAGKTQKTRKETAANGQQPGDVAPLGQNRFTAIHFEPV
jgi:hypothetical protein